MATQAITSFQLNNPVPIDTRLVVGGTNSFYSDKDDIVYKYDGLRVWDLTGPSPGTPYVWYDDDWEVEGSSAISGTGTAGCLPKFDSESSLDNSIITQNSYNIGIGFSSPNTTLNAKLHINGTVRSEGNGFYGKGSNITDINASNISSGILSLPRLQNGLVGQVLTAGPSSPIWKNMENVIDITRNSLINLRNSNNLIKGTFYHIVVDADTDIYLLALSPGVIGTECIRVKSIIKNSHYDNWGIYGQKNYGSGSVVPPSTPSNTYYCIWGGKVWRRTSGNDGGSNPNNTMNSGWIVVDYTDTTFYEKKAFTIGYNIDTNIISYQSDDRNNIMNGSLSQLNLTDWGNLSIKNNKCNSIYNNYRSNTSSNASGSRASIYDNSNSGSIYNNSNSGNIFDNSNSGNIFDNSNKGNINGNSNKGDINSNSNQSRISNNSISGNILSNQNFRYILNNNGSGDISNNGTDVQYISDNYVISGIKNNEISGDIINNNILGGINDNSPSVTDISYNRNNGSISNNDNGSRIYYNKNNGNISNNVRNVNTYHNIDINFNDNNGYISYNYNGTNSSISISKISSHFNDIGGTSPTMRTASIGGTTNDL